MTKLPERNLDQLRAIAVLAVLVTHALPAAGYPFPTLTTWLGQAGVCAFFVHTSLVLMASLERDGAPLRFYLRRAFRIYPLAWVTIAVVVAARIPGPGHPFTPPSWGGLLANLALAQDLVGVAPVLIVLWTLPLELQMYAVLPLCHRIAMRRSWRPIALLNLVGLSVGVAFMWGTGGAHYVPGLWRLDVLAYVPCFLAGVATYWYLRRQPKPTLGAGLWPLLVLGCIAAGAVVFWATGELFWLRTVYTATLGLLLPRVVDAKPTWWTATTHTVATYSYGVYLLHVPLLHLAFGLALPFAAQWLVFVVGLSAACWLGYHLIERPGIRLGQTLASRLRGEFRPIAAQPALPPVDVGL